MRLRYYADRSRQVADRAAYEEKCRQNLSWVDRWFPNPYGIPCIPYPRIEREDMPEERVLRECTTCGYSWPEAPLDAPHD